MTELQVCLEFMNQFNAPFDDLDIILGALVGDNNTTDAIVMASS